MIHKPREPFPPVIFLMGPTATGKTDLAMMLAKRLPVEIISVDSALVYRGMDIGTAKPSVAELSECPHRLVDIRDPAVPYSVADFVADAHHHIAEITAEGRIPLLVGGTMMYFKALLDGLGDMPASDPVVRQQLEKEATESGWPALHEQLMAVDPETAQQIHPNHSQRIQRALEVYRLSGRPMSAFVRDQKLGTNPLGPMANRYRVWQLALLPRNRSALHQRIAERFQRMLECGFAEEASALRGRGDLSADLPAIRAVGYRQMWSYLEGDTDFDTMQQKAIAATRQLAKRQLTWLRRWPELHGVYMDNEDGSVRSTQSVCDEVLKKLEEATIYKQG